AGRPAEADRGEDRPRPAVRGGRQAVRPDRQPDRRAALRRTAGDRRPGGSEDGLRRERVLRDDPAERRHVPAAHPADATLARIARREVTRRSGSLAPPELGEGELTWGWRPAPGVPSCSPPPTSA